MNDPENRSPTGAGGRDWPILLNERRKNCRFTEEINKSRQVSPPLHHPLFLTVFLTVFTLRFQFGTKASNDLASSRLWCCCFGRVTSWKILSPLTVSGTQPPFLFDHTCNQPRPSFSPFARYEIFSGLTRFPPYSGQERGERIPPMSAQQPLGLALRFQIPTR